VIPGWWLKLLTRQTAGYIVGTLKNALRLACLESGPPLASFLQAHALCAALFRLCGVFYLLRHPLPLRGRRGAEARQTRGTMGLQPLPAASRRLNDDLDDLDDVCDDFVGAGFKPAPLLSVRISQTRSPRSNAGPKLMCELRACLHMCTPIPDYTYAA
jgi:hypothetical protein